MRNSLKSLGAPTIWSRMMGLPNLSRLSPNQVPARNAKSFSIDFPVPLAAASGSRDALGSVAFKAATLKGQSPGREFPGRLCAKAAEGAREFGDFRTHLQPRDGRLVFLWQI